MFEPPPPPSTRLTATKASFEFAVWIEVDGREVPIYGISTPKEGPEGFVLSEVGKVSARHKETKYADMEISCCVDGGEGVAWGLQYGTKLRQELGIIGSFKGREIPGNKMQRFYFSRPQLTDKQTSEFDEDKLERLGTMEIAFQRCDASKCERDADGRGNKDWRPIRPINATLARKSDVQTVTRFGETENASPPRLTCPEIFPKDKDDLVSMQFRHVTREQLIAMECIPRDEVVPREAPARRPDPVLASLNLPPAPRPQAKAKKARPANLPVASPATQQSFNTNESSSHSNNHSSSHSNNHSNHSNHNDSHRNINGNSNGNGNHHHHHLDAESSGSENGAFEPASSSSVPAKNLSLQVQALQSNMQAMGAQIQWFESMDGEKFSATENLAFQALKSNFAAAQAQAQLVVESTSSLVVDLSGSGSRRSTKRARSPPSAVASTPMAREDSGDAEYSERNSLSQKKKSVRR
ncbi:hypothetical protein QFC21_001084 [Naganishia friedmannii]|uniref:Uncharacterized protein n=1 Tax=Naganishia friedmannii TaxID=89922 RepID=A0ACC2W8U8_9TREE|nr:hypothetical protein QFC21_001084 [Naganishia friedmannii]